MVKWFLGIDWGTKEDRACVVDVAGRVVAEFGFVNDGDGLSLLLKTVAEATQGRLDLLHAAIEVPRGAIVDTLMERKVNVFALNPRKLDRFRDRFAVSGAKDDRRDARVLADSLRTDDRAFRPLEILRRTPFQVAEGTWAARTAHIALLIERVRLVRRQLSAADKKMAELCATIGKPQEAAESGPSDAAIMRSMPGVGVLVLSTLLSRVDWAVKERDLKALRTLAGVAPVTRRSGTASTVSMRRSCDEQLRDALYHWARNAIQRDPISKAKYAELRRKGHTHGRALRSVVDRLLTVAGAMLRNRTFFCAPPRLGSAA